MIWLDYVGWFGTAVLVSNYLLRTATKIDERNWFTLNIIAGLTLAAAAFAHEAWPNFVTCIFWTLISLWGRFTLDEN